MSNLPLTGIKVCIVTATDVVNDGRVRKEARSLTAAGAEVVVIGQGEVVNPRLAEEPYRVVLVPRSAISRAAKAATNSLAIRIARRLVREVNRFRKQPVSPVVKALFSNPRTADAIAAEQPNVVHCHNVYTLEPGIAAADRVGAKLIYDARELYDGYFMAAESLPAEKQAYADKVEAAALKRADAVLTVSPLIAKILGERTGRTDVVHMFNSLPYVDVESAEPAHQPVRILNQGAFRKNTADHLIVEAMVHLRDVATLTMQGRFQRDEYRKQVEEFIAANGLEDVVTLTGEYDALQSIELANGFDIGVSVSQFDTPNKAVTLSNRFFTYLNAGIALAMPNVPAHADFPEFDTFGVLLNTTSGETVAASLRPLLEDPERLSQLKRTALESAPMYSWEKQEERLVAVYRGLVGE